jgi:Domain of unknown function DUF29
MPLAPPWTLTTEEWLDHIYIDMSRRREHALTSHLATLLQHLLKWAYQPQGQSWGHSWVDSIRAARTDAQALLARYPHLRTRQEAAYARAYPRACRQAARETGLPLATFPEACPWTPEQVLDEAFWPQAPETQSGHPPRRQIDFSA